VTSISCNAPLLVLRRSNALGRRGRASIERFNLAKLLRGSPFKHHGIGHEKLTNLVEHAKETLTALIVELWEEREERQSPIEVAMSLESGVELATGSDG